jgi:hypothetical protein
MPNWARSLAFIEEDVPSFLEVDYTILTIIVVYDCNSYSDIHSNIADHTIIYLNRLYNWRTLA